VAPPIKRPLAYGDEGADALAVQQGLWRALDPATNARNGNYGDKTVADMAAFQKRVGIQPTGSMGQATLDRLWPEMSGDQQAGYQSYKPKAPAIARALYSGDTGDDVLAVQRMLYRAGIGATNAKNGNYGQKTVDDMIRFQRASGIQSTGNMGQASFTRLWQFAEQGDRDLYLSYTPGPPPSSPSAIRKALVSAARWSISNGPNSDYQQIRPYPRALVLPFLTDCSGSTSCFYCVAGGPDPNGDDFSGYGYTGTQRSNGRSIPFGERQPGDLIFYGDGEGSQHVCMTLDNVGRAYSFGSDPPKEVAWNYRPVDMIRTYL
jgi:peptidoglycan hydrolase-like protein with peptidoglycan-binding domain